MYRVFLFDFPPNRTYEYLGIPYGTITSVALAMGRGGGGKAGRENKGSKKKSQKITKAVENKA